MSALETSPLPVLRVVLPFQTEAEFSERYCSYVTRGGLLLATNMSREVGTHLRFEFLLADESRLLFGEASVARVNVDADGHPVSMALRFSRLDAASKALVDRTVAKRLERDSLLDAGPQVGEGRRPTKSYSPHDAPAPPPVAAFVPVAAASPLEDDITAADVESPTLAEPDVASVLMDAASEPRRATMEYRLPLLPSARPTRAADELGLGVLLANFGNRYTLAHEEGVEPLPLSTIESRPPGFALTVKERELLGKISTLLEMTETRIGRRPSRIAFALPPHANQSVRRSIRTASLRAGLTQVSLVSTTAAVALAYAYNRAFTRKRLLVLHVPSALVSRIELEGTDIWAHQHFQLAAAPTGDADAITAAIDAARTLTGERGPRALDGIVLAGDPGSLDTLRTAFAAWTGGDVTIDERSASSAEQGAALLAQAHARAGNGQRAASIEETVTSQLFFAEAGTPPFVVLEAGAKLPAEREFRVTLKANEPLTLAVLEQSAPNAALAPTGKLILESVAGGNVGLTVHANPDLLLTVRAQLPSGRKMEIPFQELTEPLPPDFFAGETPSEETKKPAETPGKKRGVLRRLLGKS